MLFLYICLFVDHVNKLIIFIFGAFVYHNKNTISIYVTIPKLDENMWFFYENAALDNPLLHA